MFEIFVTDISQNITKAVFTEEHAAEANMSLNDLHKLVTESVELVLSSPNGYLSLALRGEKKFWRAEAILDIVITEVKGDS